MFQIDNQSKIPVYEQIINQIETFILKGFFEANTKIPSVRNLSATLSINPNTIQKSFSELDRRGIIYVAPGRGCFISPDAKSILEKRTLNRLTDLEVLLSNLQLGGITREQIEECINKVYDS